MAFETEFLYKVRAPTLSFDKWRKARHWCIDTLQNEDWSSNAHYFYFKKEQDAMLFILRWS